VENIYQNFTVTQSDDHPQLSDTIFILLSHRMESTGLWDIKGSEG